MALFEGSDAAVIAESLENPEAFAFVFRRHHKRIFRFVTRRIGPDAAADVTSEVFVKAFKSRTRYDPAHGEVLPWIYGIAVNTIGDTLRKARQDQQIHLHIPLETPLSFEDQTIDDLDATSLGRQLNEALGRLNDADRETLLLFALEQLSYAEIGTALGIAAGTVASRINRARRVIREANIDFGQITSWELKPDLGQRAIRNGPETKGKQ